MNSAPALLGLLSDRKTVSGTELARRLGVSRAAVWKQIEALRAAGVAIDTCASRGYRLALALDPLDASAIRNAISTAVRKRLGALEMHWKLDSTSSELSRRGADMRDRSFIFAEMQTAGRGRRGRDWLSPPSGNLYFSCLKRFEHGYAALSGLSLAVGVAVLRALQDSDVRGVSLKWPNDLVVENAKLAGILIELGGEFLGPCQAVIGIGLNVRLPASARATIGQPVTDLDALCEGVPPERNALAAALIERLCEALEIFAERGFAAFADEYAKYDVLRGRALHVHDPRGAFDGIGAGVDARGALRVRTRDGVRTLDSAEVSIRPA
ncbi:MAG TPA: biotin--[acetyl-CoA-carboxylase] ligase [Rhodanobacteraceae bacterium]|nr:biotin--[acetyl-CoA-carboxylase] ligase [Rhodanobacteraceae bacterium]